jgi:hypothetical protein
LQAIVAIGRLLRHHLPQTGDIAPAIDFGQDENGVGEFHGVFIPGAGRVDRKPDVFGLAAAAVGPGVTALLVGPCRVGELGRYALNAEFVRGLEFACVGDAVAVPVLPDSQFAPGGIPIVESTVAVVVEIRQDVKAVGSGLAVLQLRAVTEEFAPLLIPAIVSKQPTCCKDIILRFFKLFFTFCDLGHKKKNGFMARCICSVSPTGRAFVGRPCQPDSPDGGGEEAREAFRQMDRKDRQALIKFL